MSLLPVIKMCTKTNVKRVLLPRNVPKFSPIFHLRGVLEEDSLGKYMRHSNTPTCAIDKGIVVAIQDIFPGMELTIAKET